jgi:hypothetical protein
MTISDALAVGRGTILTVNQTDFSVYRIAGKRRFRILHLERP